MYKEKRCPFCDENIPNEAQKCPYCAEWIGAEQPDRNRKDSGYSDSSYDITDTIGKEKPIGDLSTAFIIIDLVVAIGLGCASPFMFDIEGFWAYPIAFVSIFIVFFVMFAITEGIIRIFHID